MYCLTQCPPLASKLRGRLGVAIAASAFDPFQNPDSASPAVRFEQAIAVLYLLLKDFTQTSFPVWNLLSLVFKVHSFPLFFGLAVYILTH